MGANFVAGAVLSAGGNWRAARSFRPRRDFSAREETLIIGFYLRAGGGDAAPVGAQLL
jgi:hypothetical protein